MRTYLGWPLHVSQYRTSADLAKAADWEAGEAPARASRPIALAGFNILVQWGPYDRWPSRRSPTSARPPALRALVDAIDALLSPLRARTVVPVRTVARSVAAGQAGPSAAPKATPAP